MMVINETPILTAVWAVSMYGLALIYIFYNGRAMKEKHSAYWWVFYSCGLGHAVMVTFMIFLHYEVSAWVIVALTDIWTFLVAVYIWLVKPDEGEDK